MSSYGICLGSRIITIIQRQYSPLSRNQIALMLNGTQNATLSTTASKLKTPRNTALTKKPATQFLFKNRTTRPTETSPTETLKGHVIVSLSIIF